MLGGQVVSKGTLLISMALLSRYLDDRSFGLLSFAVAVGLVYMFLSEMGVAITVNRRVSLTGDGTVRGLPGVAAGLRVILSGVGLAVFTGGFAVLSHGPGDLAVLVPVTVSYALDGLSEIPFAVFRASGRSGRESLARSLGGVFSVLTVSLVILLDLGLGAVTAVFVLRSAVTLVSAVALHRDTGFSLVPSFDRSGMAALFRSSLPVGVMGLALAAFQRVDNFFVRRILGIEAVGAWQECVRMMDTMVLLVTPTLLPGALFPGLCRALSAGGSAARERMRDIASTVSALGAAVTMLLVWSGPGLLALLWGGAFERGLPPDVVARTFQVVGLCILPVFWMNFLVAALIADERSSLATKAAGAGLLLLSVLLALIVPEHGLPGAAAVLLISYLALDAALAAGFGRAMAAAMLVGIAPSLLAIAAASLAALAMSGAHWTIRGSAASAVAAVVWLAAGGRSVLRRL